MRDLALMRMVHAGAVVTNWFAVSSEFHRDWRHNAEGLSTLLAQYLIPYGNLIASYNIKK